MESKRKPECFARNGNTCQILISRICVKAKHPDAVCKFCKPEREVTDGKRYPIDEKKGAGK